MIEALPHDNVRSIFHFQGLPELQTLAAVCHQFKQWAEEQPVWEAMAFKWGAAHWCEDSKLSMRQQAVKFVQTYNRFLVSKILAEAHFEFKNDLFSDKALIDQRCSEIARDFFSEDYKQVLQDVGIGVESKRKTKYVLLTPVAILHCYVLLETGMPGLKFFQTLLFSKAPLELLKAMNKDQTLTIDDYTLRGAICSGQSSEAIIYLSTLGAGFTECSYIDAVEGKQSLQVFEELKKRGAVDIASNSLDVAIEKGLCDPGIIKILADCIVNKGNTIDSSTIYRGLRYDLPLESMQYLLKVVFVDPVFLKWAVEFYAPLEILRALIEAGAQVRDVFNMYTAVTLCGIEPAIMQELLDQGGKVTEEHINWAKRCQPKEIVAMLQAYHQVQREAKQAESSSSNL